MANAAEATSHRSEFTFKQSHEQQLAESRSLTGERGMALVLNR